jgi:hypothetical protein
MMRFTERLVIAALLAFAVVSGARTADSRGPAPAEPQVEGAAGSR